LNYDQQNEMISEIAMSAGQDLAQFIMQTTLEMIARSKPQVPDASITATSENTLTTPNIEKSR
jgi:hypothetical protein